MIVRQKYTAINLDNVKLIELSTISITFRFIDNDCTSFWYENEEIAKAEFDRICGLKGELK